MSVRSLPLLALLGFFAFAGYTALAGGADRPHDGETARRWVENGALLVDVRTPEEYAAGHIPGAVNVPLQVLESSLGSLKDHEKVVVYCRSGRRSALAKDILERAGHQVYDLGPRTAWPADGGAK